MFIIYEQGDRMNFIIDDIKYQIDRDTYCWVLSKYIMRTEKSKNPGEESLVPIAYFSKYKQIAEWLLNKHIKIGDIDTFNKSIDRIEKSIARGMLK